MSVWILIAAAGLVVYFLVLAWVCRERPLTEMDRYCDAVDREWDRRAQADERRARAELYSSGGWRGR